MLEMLWAERRSVADDLHGHQCREHACRVSGVRAALRAMKLWGNILVAAVCDACIMLGLVNAVDCTAGPTHRLVCI